MKIQLYQPISIHEVGGRDNQEDALWREGATANDRLFVVCDGMGGHEKGEVASQTFSSALGKWFNENVVHDSELTDDQLLAAIDYAYKELDRKDDGSFKKMGTTLTLLYIHSRGVTAAHIGDSRIYHIRPSDRILYQSRDHSLVYDLYQAGEIAYEEMSTHPQKNVITKAVTPGEENRATPDIIHITDIKAGDYFYMCSDGMLERMSNGELFGVFSAPVSDEEKRQELVRATDGNADNHTAWIIHVESVLSEAGDPVDNEEETARCNALNIQPAKREQEEIQIADASDVKVVRMAQSGARQSRPKVIMHSNAATKPQGHSSKNNRKKKWLYPLLCFLAVACVALAVFHYFPRWTKTETAEEKDTVKVNSVTKRTAVEISDEEANNPADEPKNEKVDTGGGTKGETFDKAAPSKKQTPEGVSPKPKDKSPKSEEKSKKSLKDKKRDTEEEPTDKYKRAVKKTKDKAPETKEPADEGQEQITETEDL